ncbi:ATP12 family chaperone protein [Oceaniglobus trochenteri]|uniref:ATP12 family chaperone protein n=1 Tax=Oceaniglobus trochenteri TaxID=2763260 RepID=UPI001CFF7515|nr:ATP12 family protein [Oceaniglobus trochenteri]
MAEWGTKRFWKAAAVVPEGEGFAIQLDGRPVRTPARTLVVLPSRALADAVAGEWQAQGERINPLSMPNTRSANAALDKVAPQRPVVESMIADYAGTDLLCYRAVGPQSLIERQAERWDPLLDWVRRDLGARLFVTSGVMPVDQPPEVLAALTGTMAAMSDFDITAFHDLVSLSGSFILGLAVARGQITPDAGWSLSRLDEEWQAEQWGQDEEAAEKAALKRSEFLHAHNFMRLSNGLEANSGVGEQRINHG